MNAIASLPWSIWPPGRKVAAGIFGLTCFAALACAAIYMSVSCSCC